MMVGKGKMDRRKQMWALAGVLLAGVVLYLHSLRYASFIADDAYISLRYSQRLVEGHGLTWTDGPAVEGYSNLLWVLICGLWGWLGMDWEMATAVTGMIGSFLALWGISRYWIRSGGYSLVALMAGLLILAFSTPMAVWTHGGLEQTLFAGLLALGMGTSLPLIQPDAPRLFAHLAGAALGLASLTRPDGILVAGAIGLALLLSGQMSRTKWLNIWLTGLWVLVLFGGQMIFRLLYYGDWIPNTARAKVSISSVHLGGGIEYLLDSLLWQLPIVVIAVLMLTWLMGRKSTRARALICALPLVVFAIYLVLIGGDIFPGRRFFVTLQIPLAFIIMLGTEEIIRISNQPFWSKSVAGLAAIILAAFAYLQFHDPQGKVALKETWEHDGKVIAQALKKGFGEVQPLLAVDAAGVIPFFTQWPAVDMLGLNDAWLARNKPDGFGKGMIGHELGDGNYVLAQKPDLIMFGRPPGSMQGIFLSGRQLVEMPEFFRQYSFTTFRVQQKPEILAHFWIRQNGKLGIRRTANSLHIPAWLMNASTFTRIELDEQGVLQVPVAISAPIGVSMLSVSPGKWAMRKPCEDCERVSVSLRHHHRPFFSGALTDTLIIAPEFASSFELVLESRDIRTHYIKGLVLDRIE